MTLAYAVVLAVDLFDGEHVLEVLDGELTTDQGWTPYGQARFTIRLDDWYAAGFGSEAILHRIRFTVRLASDTHSSPGAGDGVSQLVERVFMLQRVEIDYLASTVDLRMETAELELREVVNEGPAWEPYGGGSYAVGAATLLTQLLAQIGSATTAVQIEAAGTLRPADVGPWETGQTAWDWWDRARLLALASYRINAAGNFELYGEPDSSRANAPAYFLERRREYMPSEYASSVGVTWRWRVLGEERTQYDFAEGDVGSRRHVELSYDRKPIPGYAQRVADRLSDLAYVDQVTLPLTWELAQLPAAHPPGWQSIRYAFTDEPTVQATIRTAY